MFNILYIGTGTESVKTIERLRESIPHSKFTYFPAWKNDFERLNKFLKRAGLQSLDLIIGANYCAGIAIKVADEFQTACILIDPYIDDDIFKLYIDGTANPSYELFAVFTPRGRKDTLLKQSNKVKKYIKPGNIDYAKTNKEVFEIIKRYYKEYFF